MRVLRATRVSLILQHVALPSRPPLSGALTPFKHDWFCSWTCQKLEFKGNRQGLGFFSKNHFSVLSASTLNSVYSRSNAENIHTKKQIKNKR